jgi:hypothetical protein
VAAIALLLTSGPRLYLYLTAPGDRVFLGQVWGVYDIPRYVLLTRESAAGAWLLDNRVQGPAHTGFLLYTPYILLGHLVGWTGLAPLAMMEVGRWIAMPAALAAGWLFIHRALPAGQRALGYFAAVLAGGLGLLILTRPPTPFGPALPLDITGPSFTIMNSLNMAPHVAIAVAGLAIFGWGVLAAADGDWRGLAGAPALGLVASFHGFVIPMILVAGGVFFLWRARRREVFALLLLATLASVPFGLYELSLSSKFNSNWQQDFAGLENIPSLLISRALLWPFIAIGAWSALRDPERRPGPSFALCWAVSALAFDLFPPFAQTELHRVVEGSPLAYGVLAAPGLLRLHRRPRTYLIAATMMAPVLGAGLLILGGPFQRESYLPAGSLAIAQQLERSRDTRCVVGSDLTMLWVSALSQTCDAQSDASKSPSLLRGLSSATSHDAAVALLPQPDDLIIWGDYEIEYGPAPTTLQVVGTYRRAVLLSPS